MNVIEGLKASYLADHLSEAQLQKLAEHATESNHEAGKVLVKQNERNTDLMIILEGKINISTKESDIIAWGSTGSVLGEISLLDDKPRSATVTCIGPCKIATIKATEFWSLLRGDSDIARILLYNIGQVLCLRLRNANHHIDTVVNDRTPIVPIGFWWDEHKESN